MGQGSRQEAAELVIRPSGRIFEPCGHATDDPCTEEDQENHNKRGKPHQQRQHQCLNEP